MLWSTISSTTRHGVEIHPDRYSRSTASAQWAGRVSSRALAAAGLALRLRAVHRAKRSDMSFQSLFTEAYGNLRLDGTEVDALQGETIEVGEDFRAQFFVSNRFGIDDTAGIPLPAFLDIKLEVRGTAFAAVVGGDQVIDVTNRLDPSQSVGYWVRFKALQALPLVKVRGTTVIVDAPEPFAKVRVSGRLDIQNYFSIHRDAKTFTTQTY